MGKGYISLFFEDSRYELLQELDKDKTYQLVSDAKNQIWKNYKNRFQQKTDLNDRYDLQSFVDNTILNEISSNLTEQSQKQMKDPVEYWGVSIGQAYGILKKCSSLTQEISETIKFIQNAQNIIADALSACNGIVDQSLINQLKQERNTLIKIANRFGNVSSEDSFKGLFWGSLQGTLSEAQGTLHEIASVIAATSGKHLVEKELAETNMDLQVIVEATGGKVNFDSQLMQALVENDIETGRTVNAKNDLTIAVKDGNGKVIWTTGISLKSTGAKSPNLVKIFKTPLTSMLNKKYNQEHYLNMAAGLGVNDWAGTRKGIAGLAKQNSISTSSTDITNSWKNMIYITLYEQLIDMFNGEGMALNNAQYLIVNSQVHAMYDIFSVLEQAQTGASIFSITGLEISGLGSDHGANLRADIVNKNINAFKRIGKGLSLADARISRSTSVWEYAYNKLKSTEIQISLKYNSLFTADTR